MAICNLNNNILRESNCGYQLGTIVMLYFINSNELSATTIDPTSGQSVTSITFDAGASVYQVEPAKGSANWSDTLVVADDGTRHRTHQVTFNVLGNLTPEMADNVDALSLGKYVVVVQKADGQYVMLGRNNGLEATTNVLGGSEDNSVTNGINVTLEADQAEVALPLSDNAISELLAKKKN